MVNKFNGPSWVSGSKRLDGFREDWERETFPAAQATPLTGGGDSRIDSAVGDTTSALRWPWYDAIGNMGVKLGSDVSKMRATGEDYSATEDEAEAANERFWEI